MSRARTDAFAYPQRKERPAFLALGEDSSEHDVVVLHLLAEYRF